MNILPFIGRELLAADITGLADAAALRRVDDIKGMCKQIIAHETILSGHREAFCGYICKLEAVPVL